MGILLWVPSLGTLADFAQLLRRVETLQKPLAGLILYVPRIRLLSTCDCLLVLSCIAQCSTCPNQEEDSQRTAT